MELYRCISNNSGYWLTEGKIYKIEMSQTSKKEVTIVNDREYKHFIDLDELNINFCKLQDERDEKLKQLGI